MIGYVSNSYVDSPYIVAQADVTSGRQQIMVCAHKWTATLHGEFIIMYDERRAQCIEFYNVMGCTSKDETEIDILSPLSKI